MKPTSSRITGVGARKRNNGYSERKVDPSEEFSFEPKQPNQLLGRTEPSPSDRVMPLSKLNRACTATKPSRADPPLGSVA